MIGHLKKYINEKSSGEIDEKIERIASRVAASCEDAGVDKFGFDPGVLRDLFPAMHFVYRSWFRAETHGIENIPAAGPALIIANHSGQIPVDGMLLTTSMILEAEPPRLLRSMVDYWVPGLPFFSVLFTRMGQVVGAWDNAVELLSDGEPLLIFPEGTRGLGKTWDKRYQLQDFTPGFMELAIMHDAPIIPTAVIGGEEQMPSLINAEPIAKLFNAPYFPITPTFPLFGLKGGVPYPVKYDIYFGEPMSFSAFRADLHDPGRIRGHVEEVRAHLQEKIDTINSGRTSIFPF